MLVCLIPVIWVQSTLEFSYLVHAPVDSLSSGLADERLHVHVCMGVGIYAYIGVCVCVCVRACGYVCV